MKNVNTSGVKNSSFMFKVFKYFSLISLAYLAAMAVVLYSVYSYETSVEAGVVSKDLETSIDLYQKVADSILDGVATDITLLSLDYRLPAFLDDPFGYARQGLTRHLLDVAIAKKRYDQIRVIADNGRELIRINYNNGKPEAVPPEQLQKKGHRYYVTDSLRMEPGQIYVSPLDLNVEHGELEQPLKPMLRVGTPLIDAQGREKAVLIANYLAQNLFDHLMQAGWGRIGSLYMLNDQGYDLMGPTPDGLWGFMVPGNKAKSFNKSHVAAWERISKAKKGLVQTPMGLYAFRTVSMPLGSSVGKQTEGLEAGPGSSVARPSWKLVDFISTEVMNKSAAALFNNLILILIALTAVSLPVNWWVAYNMVSRRLDRQALVESEERFRSLVNNLPGAVYRCLLDRNWTMRFITQGVEVISGYPADDFVDNKVRAFADIIVEDDLPLVTQTVTDAVTKREPYKIEYRIVNSDGEVRWVLERGVGHFEEGSKDPAWLDGFIMDITEKRRAEDRLRQIFELSFDLICVTDREGRLLAFNPSWKTNLGWNDVELEEMSLVDLVHPDDQGRTNGFLDRLGNNRETHGLDNRLRYKDGSYRWHSWSCVWEPEHKQVYMVGRDISKRMESERALREAKAAADAANEAKGQFLASMSHEIRTPMSAIIGLGELALKTNLTAKQRDYITKSQASAKSLLVIINDILDFSKIEAGKMDVENIPFNLENTLLNVANLLAEMAYDKGLELLFDPDPNLPRGLVGDPLRLSQVLVNLGNNAVKFTEDGLVKIEVREVGRKEDRITLEFLVRDTGIGISGEVQEKMFKAFSQADTSTTRRFGGTGLGLVISKRLVEMMGGEIWLDSKPGQGTTLGFTVELGLSDTEPLQSQMVLRGMERMRVLVVDDNPEARSIFISLLKAMSFRAEAVESGESAINALEIADRIDPFRLVIVDWNMPWMDGFETISRIRGNGKITSQPKLVMATAYGREDVLTLADKEKLDGLLIKPVTPSLVLDAIMEAFHDGDWCPGETTLVRPDDVGAGSGSLAGRLVLLVEDNAINQQVAREVLNQAGINVDIADNGLKAVDMVQARKYDAVLMDVQMPVMDGYEATRKIRQIPRMEHLPIIAMTAGAMAGDREKALDAGMNDFVAKPIDVNKLFTIISKYINSDAGYGYGGGSSNGVAQAVPALPSLPGLNQKAGLERLGGNRALYYNLLVDFGRQYQHVCNEVQDELAAGRREEAERLVHTLKGVAGNIGADEVFKRAQLLDSALKNNLTDGVDHLIVDLKLALVPLVAGLSKMQHLENENKTGDDKQ